MLKLFDSFRKEKLEFKPIEEGKVIMYVCGLTPYDSAHIGHARTYVAFDVLKRYLLYKGYKVYHIQNVTDVDDKIIKRAKENNINPLELADIYHMESVFLFDQLNILRANVYPRVSQYILDIVEMVKGIMEKGYAYETETGVYFDVDKFKEYGKLSNQTKEELKKHRIEPDNTKKNSYDFALWKKTDGEIIEWKTELGKGRPGWHIECSTMSLKLAKRTLDIHGGARDLIFPHHENEIAQSESYTGKRFVNYWLHTGFLTVDGVKMSKSLGNFITLKDALKKWKGESLRMFFISKKYSSGIDFSEKGIEEAEASLKRIREFYRRVKSSKEGEESIDVEKIKKEFIERIEDDLDTPGALAVLFEFIREANKKVERGLDEESRKKVLEFMDEIGYILGITLESKREVKVEKILDIMMEIREMLREKKLYDITDYMRKRLKEEGIEVKDDGKKSNYFME